MKSIKSWSEDDRPREKLLFKGINTLSNAELLAILINNGSKEKTAVELTKELLHCVNNDLVKLGKLSVKEILGFKIKGLGPAKAISIMAALELGVRRSAAEIKKEKIKSTTDIGNYLQAKYKHFIHEVFVVVFLDSGNNILHQEIISTGGITGTVVDTRIIMKKALENNATAIVLSHNHPSGNLKPSWQDKELTHKIKHAASYFDIKVLDHIIVSDEGYYSFADEGIL